MQGHGLGVIVTPMSGEDHPTLRDMACRTDKRMVLEATYSGRIVRDHVRQDQLSATGSTTHHSHTKSLEAPTRHEEYTISPYLSCGRTVWWLWKFADILDRPGR